MDRTELMGILPHREGMLLLDEAEKQGEEARGKLRIRGDEWFLRGHFPGDPIVPGVVLCEILAQSVRFKAPVRPGDLFETRCRVTRVKKPFYFAEGEGYVGDTLCVKAEFSFAVL